MRISKYFTVLIVIFIISVVLTLFSNETSLVFLKPLEVSGLHFLSPFTILTGLLMIYYLLVNLISIKKALPSITRVKTITVYFCYFIIYGTGLIIIYLIQWLYENSNVTFRVEALFSTTIEDLIWFIIFLGIFLAYLLLTFWIYTNINSLLLSFKQRMVLVIANLPVVIIVMLVSNWQIPVFPITLSFLIFIFVLDLYTEKQRLNSSWIFTLMIVISGFTALIIFSVYNRTINNIRMSGLKECVFSRDIQKEKLLNRTGDLINASELIKYCVVDSNYTSGDSFVKRLNTGFLNISDSIYFNPLNGDYIKQLSNKDEYGKLFWVSFYNRSVKKNIKSLSDFQKLIVFNKDKILFNNTEFSNIPIKAYDSDSTNIIQFVNAGYSFIKYKSHDHVEVVSIQRIPDFLRPLSMFSLLFALAGFFVLIVSILNSKFDFLPESLKITFKGVRTLKNRIQVSIIGLFVISFLSIGIIAFYYIKNLSENYQKNGSGIIASKINAEIKLNSEYSTEQGLLDLLNSKEKDEREYFYLYSDKGKIISDARRNSYKNEIFPLREINLDESNTNCKVIHRIFSIDGIDLMATIFPVSTGNKNYFISRYNLEDKLYSSTASNILSNFLNIYVFLFLLSGAIAIALANSISKPVEKLSEKLNVLNFNEKNETLEWKNNDEIGQLITIYNSTIKKLEESKKIIAKIERDSAWREMAKQVAHEIKNPLTPLKLNIQYLQGIVINYPERAGEMVTQIAPGLIEQINNLDKIATEFSDFAKMPQARNEKINLNEIVTVVHDFFRKREDLSIKLYVPINDLIVFADKNHIVSILNNIIKNAIQAIPTKREGHIVIDLYKDGENAIIKITDNGTGIAEEMLDKVFSPNFTTKSSGTGLGLAISTNMIQAFNGKIYFTTKMDEGTSFFVEIPLMRIKDNYEGQNIVSLDD
jgi:signal transduction histidine kinase